MTTNHSPWIKQLKRVREAKPIEANTKTDIAIVGGGIAGVSTAYFILKNTNKNVILVEADKVAHGATGHNAGQITSYFERPLKDIADQFGEDLAIEGQRSVESGWTLLDEIIQETKLQTPLYQFTGYAGFSSLEQVLLLLENNKIRLNGDLPREQILIAEDWQDKDKIPQYFKDFYKIAKRSDILSLLESKDDSYIASVGYRKGCMNSALFSEELITYIATNYKDRFTLYENSPVRKIKLLKEKAILEIDKYTIETEKVVLCTNGFENFIIENENNKEFNRAFHDSVKARIGYMSAYIEPLKHPPTAISYLPKVENMKNDPTGEEYFYLTRRPHEHNGDPSFNLTCIGGPEKVLPNGATYSRDESYSEDLRVVMDDFLRTTYNKYPEEDFEYAFSWHGLMGYTPNNIRMIGFEEGSNILLYNLGCNGVGILPSIFGGKRISDIIKGENIKPSIFDPRKKYFKD